jgi:hypothetical protein
LVTCVWEIGWELALGVYVIDAYWEGRKKTGLRMRFWKRMRGADAIRRACRSWESQVQLVVGTV